MAVYGVGGLVGWSIVGSVGIGGSVGVLMAGLSVGIGGSVGGLMAGLGVGIDGVMIGLSVDDIVGSVDDLIGMSVDVDGLSGCSVRIDGMMIGLSVGIDRMIGSVGDLIGMAADVGGLSVGSGIDGSVDGIVGSDSVDWQEWLHVCRHLRVVNLNIEHEVSWSGWDQG